MLLRTYARLMVVSVSVAFAAVLANAAETPKKPHVPLEKTVGHVTPTGPVPSLAVLNAQGATLADGGVNPLTKERVVDAESCRDALVVMTTAGLYETSGDWLYDIGLPGKSGVSGGIVGVAPGKGGLCTFAPPLDEAGNSVRGQLAARYLAERLGLNLFASEPSNVPPP